MHVAYAGPARIRPGGPGLFPPRLSAHAAPIPVDTIESVYNIRNIVCDIHS
jgi:hypothetical protein